VKAKRRALAERRGVMRHSQEKLAEIVGAELSTVGRWERGETSPQPWCRPTLADALTVSLEELDSMLAEGQPVEDPEQDRVLSALWSHLRAGPHVMPGSRAWRSATTSPPCAQCIAPTIGRWVPTSSGAWLIKPSIKLSLPRR
jgi:DNA-binding XRE family transcriptional regulator